MAKSDKRPPQRPKKTRRKKPSPSGHTLDPGQRQAATKWDNFEKRFPDGLPKWPKPILPFPIRPRPKPGLSPLPKPLPKKRRK